MADAARILIADDEALECRVLEKMIYDNCRDVKVLPFASDGIDLIAKAEAEKPDIIIADINMPGLNGLDAVEMLHQRYPDLLFLVVTAYSTFEYARQALSSGASGYILKPVKEKEFIEGVQKLLKAFQERQEKKQEQEEAQEVREALRSAVENQFMTELLLGEVEDEAAQRYLTHLPHEFNGVYVLVITSPKKENEGSLSGFEADIRRVCTCCGKKYKDELIMCLFPPAQSAGADMATWLKETIRLAADMSPEYASFFVGASPLVFTAKELPNALYQSRTAGGSTPLPGIWLSEENAREARLSTRNWDSFAGQLRAAMLQGNRNAIRACVDELFAWEKNNGEALSVASVRLLSFVRDILKKEIPDNEQDPGLVFLSWSYWNPILTGRNEEELSEALLKISGRLSEGGHKVYNARFCQAFGDIGRMYDREISLDSVAEDNGISSFYLSRLFKQEIGYTFLEILTDARICHALDLLFTTGLSSQVISEKCGYLNISYFYKLFKKQTGLTIGDMKSAIQRIRKS